MYTLVQGSTRCTGNSLLAANMYKTTLGASMTNYTKNGTMTIADQYAAQQYMHVIL